MHPETGFIECIRDRRPIGLLLHLRKLEYRAFHREERAIPFDTDPSAPGHWLGSESDERNTINDIRNAVDLRAEVPEKRACASSRLWSDRI
jgi:hypothetical protein